MPLTTQPTISVIVLTYKHEAYLAQALDSVLMQKVDAALEIIVTEDCSPDGTRDIVQAYQARHSEVIRPILRDKGVGGKQNLLDAYAMATGDYITVLDGDDFWEDDTKLAQQLAMLQADETLVAVGHNTRLFYDGSDQPDEIMVPESRRQPRYTMKELIMGRVYLHSSSMLFCNVFKGGLPAAQHDVRMGDAFMCILFAEHGDIGFIDKVMSAYRYTRKGRWTSLDVLTQRMATLESIMIANQKFGYRYAQTYHRSIVRFALSLVREVLRRSPARLGVLFRAGLIAAAHMPGALSAQLPLANRLAKWVDAWALGTSQTPQEQAPQSTATTTEVAA